jgi:hypothetical protein
MTDTVTVATDDNQDMQADEQILTTLNLENPASFFLTLGQVKPAH